MKWAGSGQEIRYSAIDRSILSENCTKHIDRQKQIVCDPEGKIVETKAHSYPLSYGSSVMEC